MRLDWRIVVMEMKDQRNTDIAEVLGVSSRTINRYRKALGIPGNYGPLPGREVHGTEQGFRRGCQCEPCATGHKQYVKDQTAHRQARGLPPGDERHGTLNGYRNWGCHCAQCRRANAKQSKGQRLRSNTVDIPGQPV